jgi:membrane protein implicated in regulation of membrane protease activity
VWLIWLIVAGVLAAAETVSLALVLIMLAGGAVAGAGTAAITDSVPAQFAVAVFVSLALLGLVRPAARRHLTGHSTQRDNVASLVGMDAVALSDVDRHGGRVRLNGGEWSARAFVEGQTIPAGSTVQVLEISGATAVVWHAR